MTQHVYVVKNHTPGDTLYKSTVAVTSTLKGAKDAAGRDAAILQDGRSTLAWRCDISDLLWVGEGHTVTFKITKHEVTEGAPDMINERGTFHVSYPKDKREDAELWPELYAHVTRAHPVTQFQPQLGEGKFQLPPMTLDDISFIRQNLEAEARYARAKQRKDAGSEPGNDLARKTAEQFSANYCRLGRILREYF